MNFQNTIFTNRSTSHKRIQLRSFRTSPVRKTLCWQEQTSRKIQIVFGIGIGNVQLKIVT